MHDFDCPPELVEIGCREPNAAGVIRYLASLAVRLGYARPTLADAAVMREHEFPTGLPTPIPVAIPHADREHILRPGMAVAVLRRPVAFEEMANPGTWLQVRIVFMPLVEDPADQAPLLAALVERTLTANVLSALLRAGTADEISARVRSSLMLV